MKYQIADLVNGPMGEIFTDKETAERELAEVIAEGKRMNLESSDGESDLGSDGMRVEDFISLVELPEIESITYYASIDSMGDVTEIEASNYRSWAYEQLKAEYPEAKIEVIDEASTMTSIVVSDDDIAAESAMSFCRELWDRAPWPESWSQEEGKE